MNNLSEIVIVLSSSVEIPEHIERCFDDIFVRYDLKEGCRLYRAIEIVWTSHSSIKLASRGTKVSLSSSEISYFLSRLDYESYLFVRRGGEDNGVEKLGGFTDNPFLDITKAIISGVKDIDGDEGDGEEDEEIPHHNSSLRQSIAHAQLREDTEACIGILNTIQMLLNTAKHPSMSSSDKDKLMDVIRSKVVDMHIKVHTVADHHAKDIEHMVDD